jgi:hypothetical protein
MRATVAHSQLVLHIGQGIGLALAAGLRPFTPALLAGALAGANVMVDFKHTDYSFLQSGWFLLVVAVLLAAAFIAQRRLGAERFEQGPLGAAVAGAGLGLGAVLFAAVLAQHHEDSWPGLLGGLAAAGLVQAATRGLLARARRRLADSAAREAVAVYAEAVALLVAALAIFASPLSYLAVVMFVWLWLGARRRGEQKYAGLRVLR